MYTPQLLADDFARNGFKTVIIDYFNGEPVPSEEVFIAREKGLPSDFDIGAWVGRHPVDQVLELIRKVMAVLKAGGVTRFASTGYCYGGRTGFDLGFTNELAVVTMAHPSLLKPDVDLPVRLEPWARFVRAP